MLLASTDVLLILWRPGSTMDQQKDEVESAKLVSFVEFLGQLKKERRK